ncbi:hypothetical protein D3C71_1602390 [compost metagenome]
MAVGAAFKVAYALVGFDGDQALQDRQLRLVFLQQIDILYRSRRGLPADLDAVLLQAVAPDIGQPDAHRVIGAAGGGGGYGKKGLVGILHLAGDRQRRDGSQSTRSQQQLDFSIFHYFHPRFLKQIENIYANLYTTLQLLSPNKHCLICDQGG